MSTNDLPADSKVVRYIKPTQILDDGSVDGSAFLLKPNETGLSVNWFEVFSGLSKDQQLDEVRRLSRLEMRKTGCLAEISVGKTKQHVSSKSSLRFIHKPLEAEEDYEADPSHSEIEGLPDVDSSIAALVGDMIAECIITSYPAVIG